MLFGVLGSNWAAVTVLAGLMVLVPVIVLTLFPETARRSLEEIAPESDTDI